GVGTRLGTSSDAPYLGGVYKLVEIEGRPVIKLATGKRTLPGAKQVWRVGSPPEYDVIALAHEPPPRDAHPLLAPVMRDGRRLTEPERLEASSERRAGAVAALPERLRALDRAEPPYEVRLSPGLEEIVSKLSGDHH